MTKQDIIDYVMTTPHNTNRAVLSDMLNQLAEGGGGGSSDFSTATVTIVNNYNEVFGLGMPMVDDDGGIYMEGFRGIDSGTYTIVINTTNGIYLVGDNYDVGDPQISVSGDAIHIPDTLDVIVTGDCTITIS